MIIALFAFAFAGGAHGLDSSLLSSLLQGDDGVFSAEAPGKWSGKEKSHAPTAEIVGTQLAISVEHSSMTVEHLVSDIIVLNEKRQVVASAVLQLDTPAKYSVDMGVLALSNPETLF
mmetsp:Transcript_6639/g.12214  ORF Transcript_6639/g.12214 Transcript_6639/m.12214 type:complete len:117 (-) Transcript_6639:18-368(-)